MANKIIIEVGAAYIGALTLLTIILTVLNCS